MLEIFITLATIFIHMKRELEDYVTFLAFLTFLTILMVFFPRIPNLHLKVAAHMKKE